MAITNKYFELVMSSLVRTWGIIILTRFTKNVTSKWQLRTKLRKEILKLYRSLNAIVTQSKNCPFGVNTTIELNNIITTSVNIGI
jgi:hypothetical protein